MSMSVKQDNFGESWCHFDNIWKKMYTCQNENSCNVSKREFMKKYMPIRSIGKRLNKCRIHQFLKIRKLFKIY